jgi:serine/threonine protein kinase
MAITIRDPSIASSHRLFTALRDPEQMPPHNHPPPLPPPSSSSPTPKLSMWQRLGLGRWLHHRDDRSGSSSPTNNNTMSRRITRKVGVGLPRPATFRRQNSEQRDRLAPTDPEPRRAQSVDRRRTLSVQRTQSPPPAAVARLSAPEVGSWVDQASAALTIRSDVDSAHEDLRDAATLSHVDSAPSYRDDYLRPVESFEDPLELELERKWILNLSMHFRDKSEREKFFVTYAERPNRWRRVTISCDYRGAPPGSLEDDLKELHYQRDKSARIYESIRESLPDIQFYDTVTNLRLDTSDGRLHVHVTEDVNEIIPYPPITSIGHLKTRLIRESELSFDTHLSGFVYRVKLDGRTYIKKEIPGPDTVDEFLYEINALHALSGSKSVIQFEGIIVDDRCERLKGLIISYAEQGALVDVLYDFRGQLTIKRRERWARQIVQGLCEIHEAGYVQGDFTLSNIVIDADDNAKIIDINRRGCPVGWEPPEIAAKIESNQRITMYIGVKSDLFQLGMTLWALAMEEDEPERQPRPLFIPIDAKVPDYYRRVIAHCLSDRLQERLSAKELLSFFPVDPDEHMIYATLPQWITPGHPPTSSPPYYGSLPPQISHRSVCLDDEHDSGRPGVVYVTPAEYDAQEIDYPPRGRRPSTTHALPPSDYQPSMYVPSSASPNLDGRRSISHSDFELHRASSPDLSLEPRFEEVEFNGTQYLVNPDGFSAEEFEALRDNTHEPHDSQELQSAHSSGLSRVVVPSSTVDGSKETEVDLDRDANLDSRARDTTNDKSEEKEVCRLPNSAFLGDIAGIGGHASCSLDAMIPSDLPQSAKLKSPAINQSLSMTSLNRKSSLRQSGHLPAEVLETKTNHITETEIPMDQYIPSGSKTNPEASLLSSRLPINPALAQPATLTTELATTQSPQPPHPGRTSFLLDSILPINPASSMQWLDGSKIAASLPTHIST